MFAFRYDRDAVIGFKGRTIFAAFLSCFDAVKNARYLSQMEKVFSTDFESRAIFCHVGEMLSGVCNCAIFFHAGEMLLGGCRSNVIIVIWSTPCQMIEKAVFTHPHGINFSLVW